jgi:DNA-(apurinic or apyrimidinic site) lyase
MQADKKTAIQERLAEILGMIPKETWQSIVEMEPEWQHLEPLCHKFPGGSFCVFMMTAGLNAFQLKGKAETAYWAKLRQLLDDCESVSTIKVLVEFLVKFYQKERLYNCKLERLARFMNSSLVFNLWVKTPKKISLMTAEIWTELANIMNQAMHDKTICFAMKCLGISLMISGEYDFAFQEIPIPVDSRITKFTKKLGVGIEENTRKIQGFWQGVLSLLHPSLPSISMIHLDSLIWQIAHHDTDELFEYFRQLGIPRIGRSFIHLC